MQKTIEQAYKELKITEQARKAMKYYGSAKEALKQDWHYEENDLNRLEEGQALKVLENEIYEQEIENIQDAKFYEMAYGRPGE